MFHVVQKEENLQIEDKTEQNDCVIVHDGVPLSPEWMAFEARMEWMRSAPELYKKGQLIGGNIALLENYCIAIGFVREFEAIISTDGKFVNGKPHPAFKLMLDYMSQAKSIASELKFGKEIKQEENSDGENSDSSSKWKNGLLA